MEGKEALEFHVLWFHDSKTRDQSLSGNQKKYMQKRMQKDLTCVSPWPQHPISLPASVTLILHKPLQGTGPHQTLLLPTHWHQEDKQMNQIQSIGSKHPAWTLTLEGERDSKAPGRWDEMNGGSNSSEEPVLEQGGRRPRSLAWVSGVWRLQRNPEPACF